MYLKLQSKLDCSVEAAWQEVKKVSLLQYVAEPLVTFSPVQPAVFPEFWPTNGTVVVDFRILNLIPFGNHSLEFEAVDEVARTLQTREKSMLLKKWDHLIRIESVNGETIYTDEVELSAGILTPIVWLFANFFYRHRQRRWRKLAPQLDRRLARTR